MGPVADRSSVELDELAWKFLGSEFSQDIYADWPLDRRLDAYLRHHQLGGIVNDGAVYSSLLDRVMTNIGAAHRGGILSHGADEQRRRLEPEMTQTEPGEDVIRNALMVACRAPSSRPLPRLLSSHPRSRRTARPGSRRGCEVHTVEDGHRRAARARGRHSCAPH